MSLARPAYLSDTFFFLHPETRLDSLLNADRFTRNEPSRFLLAVSATHLQPDRLLTVATNRNGQAKLAFFTRFEATRRTGWIAGAVRANDSDIDGFGALIDETVRRVGREGLYNCAVTLDQDSGLSDVFLRNGFIRRGLQSVYSGSAAPFLKIIGAKNEACWQPLRNSAAADPFQRYYWRRLRDHHGSAAPYYRRGCRMYGLRDGERILGFAAVTGLRQTLYIEPWLTSGSEADTRIALSALIVQSGAMPETRLSICIPERQPLLNGCVSAEYQDRVDQVLYLKQLTVPISRRRERTVGSFSDLTVATFREIDFSEKET